MDALWGANPHWECIVQRMELWHEAVEFLPDWRSGPTKNKFAPRLSRFNLKGAEEGVLENKILEHKTGLGRVMKNGNPTVILL